MTQNNIRISCKRPIFKKRLDCALFPTTDKKSSCVYHENKVFEILNESVDGIYEVQVMIKI